MIIPHLTALGARIFAPVWAISDGRVVEKLRKVSQSRAAEVVEVLDRTKSELSPPEQSQVQRIEEERKRLLKQTEALIDGSAGEGGPFDKAVSVQQACRVSKRREQATLLLVLARVMNPKSVIELGTNVGISSAYIASGLALNAEGGKLVTVDASPYRLKLARQVHSNLGMHNIDYIEGMFSDVLSEALQRAGKIDLAFIDGHHRFQPTMEYFERVLQHAAADAVFVFDDIRWSGGMKRAWSALKVDQRLGLVVDLYSMGVCIRSMDAKAPRYVLPPIYSAFRK
jgi:predicted O-methyltransferase YrrM